MLDFHKVEGAPEILEGNEFKLNWTKAELTLSKKFDLKNFIVSVIETVSRKNF